MFDAELDPMVWICESVQAEHLYICTKTTLRVEQACTMHVGLCRPKVFWDLSGKSKTPAYKVDQHSSSVAILRYQR
jgi:hypothetical protein